MLKAAIPVLHVSSAAVAEDFYCGLLGFAVSFSYRVDSELPDPCYMGLHRDGVVIHVSSFPGDAVSGGVVYVIVEDVDALHSEFLSKGTPIDLDPTDQTWGNREMYVKDTDGNCVRYVQEQA